MRSNLERYKKDLDSLIERGDMLVFALEDHADSKQFRNKAKRILGEKTDDFMKRVPVFRDSYQTWYSEAKTLVKQLLTDRLEDFCRLYERPRSRREITHENYTIEDALIGLTLRNAHTQEVSLDASAAYSRLNQQIAIVKGVKARFESSLFDVHQLLQADLFDSELDAANHLLKNKFSRAAGALAGVVLENHLGEVASSHGVSLKKKDPTIADLNDALKAASVIDTAQWRFIQHLGDIRNLCDHAKTAEPTSAQVQDLLDGVSKVIKTVF